MLQWSTPAGSRCAALNRLSGPWSIFPCIEAKEVTHKGAGSRGKQHLWAKHKNIKICKTFYDRHKLQMCMGPCSEWYLSYKSGGVWWANKHWFTLVQDSRGMEHLNSIKIFQSFWNFSDFRHIWLEQSWVCSQKILNWPGLFDWQNTGAWQKRWEGSLPVYIV